MKTKHKKSTIEIVAAELAQSFMTTERADSGERIYKVKPDAPDWVKDGLMLAVHRAVDGQHCRLPCDWVYSCAGSAADNLADRDGDFEDYSAEIADGLVDIYNSDRTKWLAASSYNDALCTEAKQEFGGDFEDINQLIGMGQYLGASRIVAALIREIENEAESRDADELHEADED